ncbi:hypothetical protein DL96DRAFT_150549 [Flagelloscypha sp. PMI_526]|nr:hypothetical protein DL96DRAFT_150549 [Flagelloscypha sp. PMI_526]
MTVQLLSHLLFSSSSNLTFQVARQYTNQQRFLDDLKPLHETAPLDLCVSWPLSLRNGPLETAAELQVFYQRVADKINENIGSSFMYFRSCSLSTSLTDFSASEGMETTLDLRSTNAST